MVGALSPERAIANLEVAGTAPLCNLFDLAEDGLALKDEQMGDRAREGHIPERRIVACNLGHQDDSAFESFEFTDGLKVDFVFALWMELVSQDKTSDAIPNLERALLPA